jgi:hypothetical protein
MSPICSLISRACLNPYRDEFQISFYRWLSINKQNTPQASIAMSFNSFSLTASHSGSFTTPAPSEYTTHESFSKTPSHRDPFKLYNPSTPAPSLNGGSKRRSSDNAYLLESRPKRFPPPVEKVWFINPENTQA